MTGSVAAERRALRTWTLGGTSRPFGCSRFSGTTKVRHSSRSPRGGLKVQRSRSSRGSADAVAPAKMNRNTAKPTRRTNDRRVMDVLCHIAAWERMRYLHARRTGTGLSCTMTSRSYWTAVWCGFVVLAIGLGVRQSFGIFLVPVSAELHVGRELFSFGTAASMLLMGVFAPIAGRLADRFGSAPTIAGGGVLYVLGMIVTATMHSGFMLVLGNILVGTGLSAASFGPVLGVVLRTA